MHNHFSPNCATRKLPCLACASRSPSGCGAPPTPFLPLGLRRAAVRKPARECLKPSCCGSTGHFNSVLGLLRPPCAWTQTLRMACMIHVAALQGPFGRLALSSRYSSFRTVVALRKRAFKFWTLPIPAHRPRLLQGPSHSLTSLG